MPLSISSFLVLVGLLHSSFYAHWQNLSLDQARTFAFAEWIISLTILAFVSRSEREPLFSSGVFTNRGMNLWAVIAIAFMFIAIGTPAISVYLNLSPITFSQLGVILVIAVVSTLWLEVREVLLFRKKFKKHVVGAPT
jgi:Ca2+-transporting ATPase